MVLSRTAREGKTELSSGKYHATRQELILLTFCGLEIFVCSTRIAADQRREEKFMALGRTWAQAPSQVQFLLLSLDKLG